MSHTVEQLAYRLRLEVFQASRDAGQMLTVDAVGDGLTAASLVSAAASVANYVDEAIAIARDEHRPSLDCSAGCAYCCRKPGVLVTVPELMRILDYAETRMSAPERGELARRARRYAAQVEGHDVNAPTPESVPCPMLVEERCTAYQVRPAVCRGYNSTSRVACQRAHEDVSARVPVFAMIKDAADGATVGAAQALKTVGLGDALVDLGTALNIALSLGEDSAEVLAADPGALGPAMHRTWAAELWQRVCETAGDLNAATDSRSDGERR